jgi:hypothetical protein
MRFHKKMAEKMATNDTNKTTIDPTIETMILVESDHPSRNESHIKKIAPAENHTHMITPSPTRKAMTGPEEMNISVSTRIAQTTDMKQTHTT